jgi:hypothetical protein
VPAWLLLALAGLFALGDTAPAAAAGPLLADRFTWDGFVTYWAGYVRNSDQVVQVVLLVMVAALFIITRGKWRK